MFSWDIFDLSKPNMFRLLATNQTNFAMLFNVYKGVFKPFFEDGRGLSSKKYMFNFLCIYIYFINTDIYN